ncbi:hypothetical protein [Streptomyces venezuelae]|uniref:Uncharacterized protein n=1 Tax=Streptomyces venezuelae TaxID=54571 RepID=A0A5P2BGH8_STRVZ|nr:hypothetical protein [Streptomyces venezuelae]QES29157.1 hypothetical protein DEJ47_24405 [Streptomyces venezuelae]
MFYWRNMTFRRGRTALSSRMKSAFVDLLAIPERGHEHRASAALGYGLLATAVVFTGTMAVVEDGHGQAAKRTPFAAVPDHGPTEADMPGNNVETGEEAVPSKGQAQPAPVFSGDERDGYVPTYFDGHGGIAGVPLTEEQCRAVVAEAMRRGMPKEAAHDLAYGADSETVGEDTVLADGGARQPVYRKVAPTEVDHASVDAPARSAGGGKPVNQGRREGAGTQGRRDEERQAGDGKGQGRPPEKREKPSVADVFEQELKDQIPDPIEDVLGPFNPFRAFLADLSMYGADVELEVSEPDPVTDTVTVTGSTTVSDDVAVTVEAEVPVEESRPGERKPCTITTTVKHPETGVVKSESTAIVHDPDDVPRVAVNEVVDAVLEASDGAGAEEEVVREAVEDLADARDL